MLWQARGFASEDSPSQVYYKNNYSISYPAIQGLKNGHKNFSKAQSSEARVESTNNAGGQI